MRAIAAFPLKKRVEIVDHPEPRLETETGAKIRILDVGVCEADREIVRFDPDARGTPPAGQPYLVIGTQSLGQVVEVGRAVRRVKPGDFVVTRGRRPCELMSCPACPAGRPDLCVTGEYTQRGLRGHHGFMTDLVVDEERYLHVVPKHLANVGVLAAPLSLAEKAFVELVNVKERLLWVRGGQSAIHATRRGRAIVLGAGPVGLLGAMALSLRGFETWVYSREAEDGEKADWVRSIGAHYASTEQARPSELSRRIGNVDLIYETSGAPGFALDALDVLGQNGVYVFTGVTTRLTPLYWDANLVLRNIATKNQLICGTVDGGPDAFDRAVRDLGEFQERWPHALRKLLTRFPPSAFSSAVSSPLGVKGVVSFGTAA
jgi:threonine dehydrogenase-like Zn-dependent dehydrogenase